MAALSTLLFPRMGMRGPNFGGAQFGSAGSLLKQEFSIWQCVRARNHFGTISGAEVQSRSQQPTRTRRRLRGSFPSGSLF